MAEEHHNKSHEFESTVVGEGAVETKDRGMFDFLGKKEEEKPQEEVIVTEFAKVQVSEPEPKVEGPNEEEGKKPGLLEKLHRSGSSSSSSSSDEEEGEGEEKKKKKKKEKKGLKEKMAEEKEEEKYEDTVVPVEVVDQEPPHPEEKKGFLNKIKDKLPGQHKKTDEVPPPPPPVESTTPEAPSHEAEAKEKKGLLEKIKEKIPGYHPKTEEEKEKEKESASH
ncbi:phosphoprotein ECPP44 [Pistacia vera]|uniref:phosphoprotein ECPP44 n=1 Tax=Pistacia vera TaxID=55513 RepID=UPI001262C338|nr:phosphoprotein ECPP44 [Pistacia vera]